MPRESHGKVVTKKHLARIERERRQRRYILATSLIVLLLVVGFIGYGVLDQTVLKPQQPVAQVGSDKIALQDWQARVRFTREQIINQYMQYYQLQQAFGSDASSQSYFTSMLQQISAQLDPTSVGQQTLDVMINDALIKQEAQKRGITVSEDEISKYLQGNVFGFYPNGTPTPTATDQATQAPATLSPEQLAIVSPTPTITPTSPATPTPTQVITGTQSTTPTQTGLATPTPVQGITPTQGVTSTQSLTPTATALPTLTPTPYTTQEFKNNYDQFLQSYKTSADISEAQIRDIVKAELLRQKVMDAVTADFQKTQDEVWTRQIVVTDTQTADQVIARVKKGEDFGKVASEVSTDAATKSKGGDMGWQMRYQMDPAVADAAFALKNVGDISQPVKVNNQYYIIQLVGKRTRTLTNSEVDSAKQTIFQDWLTKQRDASNVKTYDTVWQAAIPTIPTIPPQYQQTAP